MPVVMPLRKKSSNVKGILQPTANNLEEQEVWNTLVARIYHHLSSCFFFTKESKRFILY